MKSPITLFSLLAAALCAGAFSQVQAAEDILIADFEGPDYAGWNVEGTAFGTGPALANVAPPGNTVLNYRGRQLVNTYYDGDRSIGALASPPFAIQRKYIKFLLGGGNHPESAFIQLKIDGRPVRTATGGQRKEKGREILDWHCWDVSEFSGKTATIEIVDRATGSWGHILADEILQTDNPECPAYKLTESYESILPKYDFEGTLQQQETQLKNNALLEKFRVSRQRMKADPLLPIYHFTSPMGRTNDPNGLCFWKGNWHLFYQAYPPADPRQHWGHAVSSDLVHWRDLPYAIYPNPEQCVFSGSTYVEEDRVIAMYHGTRAGSMVALSDDPLLLNWEKLGDKPVIALPGKGETLPYNVFDPFLWKEDGLYYALTAGWRSEGPGGKRVRREWLHRSPDLEHWEYLHPFLEDDRLAVMGDDGACPYFWPLGGKKHMLLHFSHMSGGKYVLGNYDKQRKKFVVTDAGNFNFGPVAPGGTHAPSATPDGKGGLIAIFNMNEGFPAKNRASWSGIMTLARRIWLDESDSLRPLRIEPAGDTDSLRCDHKRIERKKLPANTDVVLNELEGNAFEIAAVIDCQKAQAVELDVLRSPGGEETTRIVFYPKRGYAMRDFTDKRSLNRESLISIDTSRSSTHPNAQSRAPETAPVFIPDGEKLNLRVFVDKSVVEVFVNGRQCLALRVYPARSDSVGISLRAQGSPALVESLDFWKMRGIF